MVVLLGLFLRSSQTDLHVIMLLYLKKHTLVFVGDYVVPKETNVGVFVLSLHRDPQVFPDPETFDPMRFSSETCDKRSPFAYIPFSAGPRNCIGKLLFNM